MSVEANQPGATTLSGAAGRLSSLLKAEQPPTAEGDEVQGGSPEPEEQENTQEAASEESTETVEEPTGQPEADDVETFTVKVSGEERDVTLDDLKKGYMMESDYRNKTTALSAEREALETKQSEIDTQLSELQAIVDLEFEGLDSDEMKALKQDDPEAYLEKFDKAQKKKSDFEKFKAKRESEQKEKANKLLDKERENLMVAFPEWRDDPKAFQSGIEERSKILANLGYTENELGQMIDSRMWVLADKAMKLDAIMAKTLDDKVTKAKPKTNRAGTSLTTDERKSEASRSQRQKLKKSGNVKDAAALFSMK